MRYMGGKSKIARPIAEIITRNSPASSCFVSLFCGTCSVEARVTGFERKILNDKHKYLIAMLSGVQGGYELPEAVSKEQYTWLKEHQDADPVLTGFVGFGCSFGGIWFDSYANCSKGRNYCAESKRSLLKDLARLSDAEFICGDYRSVCIPPHSTIYADPPYKDTKGYNGERFDTDTFWMAMRLLAETGHTVFISEQQAPPDFLCIWEQPFTRTVSRSKDHKYIITEKLFTYYPQRRPL